MTTSWAQVLSAKSSKNTTIATANTTTTANSSPNSSVGPSTVDATESIPLDALELEDKKSKKTSSSSKSEKKKSKNSKKKNSQESIKIPKQPQYAKIVHTPARSENITTLESNPSPTVDSWPSLDSSSVTVTNHSDDHYPASSFKSPTVSSEDGSVETKSKKWSKVPMEIHFNNPIKSSSNKHTTSPKGNSSNNENNRSYRSKDRSNKKMTESPRSASLVSSHQSMEVESSRSQSSNINMTLSSSSFNHNNTKKNYKKGEVSMSRGASSSRGYNYNQPYSYYYPYNPSMDSSYSSGYAYAPSTNMASGVNMEMIQMWIRAQVEYYFSLENLCRDMFFRKQMDPSHGGINISVIYGFNRVKSLLAMATPLYLAENPSEAEELNESSLKYKEWLLNLLMSCIESSEYLELIQEKSFVRLKQGWEYWILSSTFPENHQPSSSTLTTTPTTSTPTTTETRETRETTEELKMSENDKEKAFDGQKTFSNPTVLPNSSIFPTPPLSPHISKIANQPVLFSSSPMPDEWNDHSSLVLITQQPKTLAFGENVIHIPNKIQSDFLNSPETVEAINHGMYEYESSTWPQSSLRKGTRFWPQENNLGAIGWFIHPQAQASPLDFTSLKSVKGVSVKGFQILKENKFIMTDYASYFSKAIKERVAHGMGKSYKMNLLYKFWSVFLPLHFNNQMYSDFCLLAVEDAQSNHLVGLQHLFKFYEMKKNVEGFGKDYQAVLEWDKTRSPL